MSKPRRSRKAISQRRAQRQPGATPGPSYTPPAGARTVASSTPRRPWYRDPIYLGIGVVVLLIILGVGAFLIAWQLQQGAAAASGAESTAIPAASPAAASPVAAGQKEVRMYNQYPSMVIDQNKNYQAVIETDKGDITVDLFAQDAPKTVNSFVFLAREGFYDGVSFHRVIPGFVAQGGDPTGTGTGGPGYRFEDEINQHKVAEGALAMANAGPGTNGSQFFITYSAQPHLDGKHTVFGRVSNGLDIAKSLNPAEPGRGGQPSVIKTIRIQES